MNNLIKMLVSLVLILLGSSNFIVAQQNSFKDFSTEVQAKISDNKSKGLPQYTGLNFKYVLTVDPQFRNEYANSSDVNNVLSSIKADLKFDSSSFTYADNKDLIVVFQGQHNLSYDEIKIRMTEKKLYLLNITLTTSLK